MRQTAPAPRRQAGFTLLELMIVVAIIGILASIATPMYGDYVRRSKIVDATTALGDMRTDMEKYFMDNRTYLDGGACHVVTSGKVGVYNGNPASHFTINPVGACTATTYVFAAVGKAADGMGGFEFRINEANTKWTVSLPAGWTPPAGNCWAVKKDGSC